MSSESPRFGIWIPVYGNWAGTDDALETHDASFSRAKATLLEAEELGFETALLAQHLINPRDNELDQLETWTATAALAAWTKRIELIAAIKPKLFHPAVLAKMALGIEDISGGRLAINLVNAWYRPELEDAGIPFDDHDERYDYGREWIQIVRALISGERVNFSGKYFQVKDYALRPVSRFRRRPLIYVGGESEPARNLAADFGDFFFSNGHPLAQVTENIRDVAHRPRASAPLRFAMSAFVITRATQEEAEAAHHELSLVHAKRDISKMLAHVDPKAVMFQSFRKYPHIGSNGGTAAGLVGNYDLVAERIMEFHAVGVDTFVLQFQPFREEQRRFADEIIPRVRRLGKLKSSAPYAAARAPGLSA
jgi:alkanesulfonate monooxygenase